MDCSSSPRHRARKVSLRLRCITGCRLLSTRSPTSSSSSCCCAVSRGGSLPSTNSSISKPKKITLILFWHTDPAAWFRLAEATFNRLNESTCMTCICSSILSSLHFQERVDAAERHSEGSRHPRRPLRRP